jgi:S-(hydroxymethyl)glutathione dehydrogenase/alcohol dehydrogenase
MITTDVAEAAYIRQALSMVGKRGRVVVTSVAHPEETKADMSLFELTMYEKEVKGALFGSSNAQVEIPRILNLYRQGQVKLDELVTTTYALRDVNQGYQDMRDGKNIRGMITYE